MADLFEKADSKKSLNDHLQNAIQIDLNDSEKILDEEFIEMGRSTFAKEEDLVINTYRKKKIREFQKGYWCLVTKCSEIFQEDPTDVLVDIIRRSQLTNKPNCLTGDGVTHIVDLILNKTRKLKPWDLFELIQNIAMTQNFNPEKRFTVPKDNFIDPLMIKIMEIIKDNREGL